METALKAYLAPLKQSSCDYLIKLAILLLSKVHLAAKTSDHGHFLSRLHTQPCGPNHFSPKFNRILWFNTRALQKSSIVSFILRCLSLVDENSKPLSQSPFLTLPPEIRDLIYATALTSSIRRPQNPIDKINASGSIFSSTLRLGRLIFLCYDISLFKGLAGR
jgi:hypothetical protein